MENLCRGALARGGLLISWCENICHNCCSNSYQVQRDLACGCPCLFTQANSFRAQSPTTRTSLFKIFCRCAVLQHALLFVLTKTCREMDTTSILEVIRVADAAAFPLNVTFFALCFCFSQAPSPLTQPCWNNSKVSFCHQKNHCVCAAQWNLLL